MRVHFLTRHREPKPTESLYGYLLHLTFENGYARPSSVLSRAGILPQKVVGRDVDVRKLANIAGHAEALSRIAYNAEKYGDAYLLGQRVGRTDIRRGATALCPQCITEQGFLQAHFDLKLMVACPTHKSYLTESCAECDQELQWSRPGLLQCSCGAALPPRSTQEDAPLSELNLLRLLREKVLGSKEHIGAALQDHERDLMTYDLEYLLFTIRQLGKHWSRVHGGPFDFLKPTEIISNAARVLFDWPKNFNRLIHLAVEERSKENLSTGTRREFAVLYREMFAHQGDGLRQFHEKGLVWNAYVAFAIQNWGRDAADPRLFREFLGSDGQFITAAEVSRRTGIHRKTIIRMANDGELEAYAPSAGSLRSLIAVTAVSKLPPRDSGKVLNVREAARMLGVSVGVLKILKARRVYRIQHYTRGFHGFHEDDLEELRRRLASPPSICKTPAGSVVSFTTLMKSTAIGPEAKADLIEAIIAGRLSLAGPARTSVDELQIPIDSISNHETKRLALNLACHV